MQFLDNLTTCLLLFCYFVLHDPPSLVGERSHRSRGWTSLQLKGFGLAGALAILTVGDAFWTWLGWHGQIHIFQWIGAAAGGVALALMIGRLGSKAIGAPIWVVALLYLYAVLQGAIISFGGVSAAEELLFLLALALKSVLVLFLTWVLASQRLTIYIREVRYFEALRRTAEQQIEDVVLESDSSAGR